MSDLLESRIPGLEPVRRGKVRELYDLGDHLLMIATDRVSAFDVVMTRGVPGKGVILNRLSAFWFERLATIADHHLVSIDDDAIADRLGARIPELAGRAALIRKAKPIPVECVARGFLAGSLLKEYRRWGPNVHSLDLPPGLQEGDPLPAPIFTPATKAAEGHDENMSFAEVADQVGFELAATLRDLTLRLYRAAREHAESAGLILADTKFEFGLCDDGLIWIDEALTPDSSRYWEANAHRPGRPRPSYDKQPLRDWLEASGWDKRPPGPRLPDHVVADMEARYRECYRRLTGSEP